MLIRTSSAVALVLLVGDLAVAGSASNAVPTGLYGRPGKVSPPVVQGYHPMYELPLIHFRASNIWRAPGAARKAERICSTYEISAQRGPPYGGWAVVAQLPACGWANPGSGVHLRRPPQNWNAGFNAYHVRVVVTWKTRTRKLAQSSWDYNDPNNYECLSGGCVTDYDSVNDMAYIGFTAY